MNLRWLPTLLVALAVLAAEPQARATDADQMVAATPESMKFIPIPDMPHCATAAILRGDPRSGPAWVLLKLTSGCRVPWHWHTPTEELVVISGHGTLPMRDSHPLQFVPGAYAHLPSHHVHEMTCSRTCLFFNSADAAFDIHYVDANGQEISLQQALKPPAAKKRGK